MIARVPPPDLSRNGGQVGWSTNMSADDWPDALLSVADSCLI